MDAPQAASSRRGTGTVALTIDMDPFADPITLPLLMEGYSCKDEVSMTILCHDRTFKRITVVDDATRQTLFTVEGKGSSSLSWRRAVLDKSGDKLFELRHLGCAMKNDWAVENLQGNRICSLKHVTAMAKNRSDLDAIIHSQAADLHIEVRPKDRSALSTIVKYRGVGFATIQQVEANDVTGLEKKGLDRTVWKSNVIKGADLSLVLVVVLCVAEMEHVWRQ